MGIQRLLHHCLLSKPLILHLPGRVRLNGGDEDLEVGSVRTKMKKQRKREKKKKKREKRGEKKKKKKKTLEGGSRKRKEEHNTEYQTNKKSRSTANLLYTSISSIIQQNYQK